MVKYVIPRLWLNYDIREVMGPLIEAKASIRSLVGMPYQRSWVEALQAIQLKREIAGTSRIEGADFTERELEVALAESGPAIPQGSRGYSHSNPSALGASSEIRASADATPRAAPKKQAVIYSLPQGGPR